jgi:DNA segregation ATPase FtsK/SpoIIIE-like protein
MFWRRHQEMLGIALIGIAAIFFISIVGYDHADYFSLIDHAPVKNLAGPMGAWIGHIAYSIFGIASFGIVITLIVPGTFLIRSDWVTMATEKSILLLLLTFSMSAVISLFTGNATQISGGNAGLYISGFCAALVGKTISCMLLSAITLIITVMLVYILVRKNKDGHTIPNGETQDNREAKKFPWIVKKRIMVYETEKTDQFLNSLKYPALPVLTGDDGYGLITENDGGNSLMLEKSGMGDDSIDEDAEVILRDDEYTIDRGSGMDTAFSDDSSDDRYDVEEEIISENDAEVLGIKCEVSDDAEPYDDDRIEDNGKPARKAPLMDSKCPVEVGERVFNEIPINEEYIIPTSFLTSSKPLDSESWKNEIRKNSILLKNTLAEFGIEADVVNVNRGPVITLYEMQIAPGIKVNRVVGLADDIAMALAAQRVRIVAPIPGKSAIGVEIPNRYRETVTLGDIVKSDDFQSFEGSLVVALGKDILGKPVMLDLKRLPHLLIAGTTGSGKSVCVNSIITSLLYNYDPNYVRFILVDPKMVELQFYNGLPHLLTPVIVDPMVAPMVLKWTIHEMQRRYCLLSDMNTRDIQRYNEKIERQRSKTEKLPYIVVIVDEMADLMMSSKEVEGYITRIAQKSRAVGIHLVLATQRPSVDIITGLIKANFPARVAFQVAQKTDSRTIIDQNGAEKLLGRGDMLFQPPTSSFPIRVQGGFISEEEIEKITAHLCKLGKPSYIDIEESLLDEDESNEIDETSDELFREAMKIIEETKKASASYLQRRLSIGYNRAARIIEQMEDKGYIGPQIGSKPREVFI